jgi:pimeloyl-ACP methyl ester carboxylesterase
MRKRWAALLPLFLLLALPLAAPAAADAIKLAVEETMVPAKDPGIELYVRNKRPEGVARFGPDRTLLFVHGATYPSETAFDLSVGGKSWMEFIAERGFDVYLMDLRGYGRSTRPKEMDAPADANPPIVTTDVAVRDVSAVVDHILQKRGLDKLDVMGWSWGTAIMAGYAQENPQKVNRLVLYATLWNLEGAPPISAGAGRLGAYRVVKREDAYQRWVRGVPEEKRKDLIPAGWFDAWADATFASDPWGAKQDPPVLRAPNGVLLDIQQHWQAAKPTWEPEKIRAPVLMVMAEWDRDTPPYMSQAVFPRLVNAPWKRFVMIGEGTHTIVLEKNRQQLFDAVQAFLEEPPRR